MPERPRPHAGFTTRKQLQLQSWIGPKVNYRKLRLISSIVLVTLVLVFALQNVATVEVQFLFWSLPLPRSLLLFLVLVIGVIAGWFLRGATRKPRG